MDHHDTLTAWAKVFVTWLVLGVSAMSPLQVVQLIAALAATVYSVVQTFLLLRKHFKGRK